MTALKVATFPRDTNPYQELLHSALRSEEVQPGYLAMPTPSRTLNLLLLPATLTRMRISGIRVLHLHWVFAFALPGSRSVPAVRMLAQLWFGLILLTCRALGIRVVWTAHNVLPHERVFWDDRAGRRMLLKAASHVIVHDQRVVAELAGLMDDAADLPPMTVVPHGSYAGWYAQGMTPAQARDQLGLPAEAMVLLFFGRVTAQKGVEELATSFSALCTDRPETQPLLVIAGRCTDEGLARELARTAASLRDWVRLDLRFLTDAELAVYLTAADATVLPFRTATTSGSVVLALTMGRIAVVPALPAFDGLPGETVVRYDPMDQDGLRSALATVCATPRTELARRGAVGRESTGTTTWAEAGRLTAGVYRALVAA